MIETLPDEYLGKQPVDLDSDFAQHDTADRIECNISF
jgi:hypothetical protein